MTVCDKIYEILKPLNLPVAENVYRGPETEYFTFNVFSEHPVLFADDESIEDAAEVYLHYFTKDAQRSKKTLIKKLLKNNEISIIDIENLYENDTGYIHVIFQIQIVEDQQERNDI